MTDQSERRREAVSAGEIAESLVPQDLAARMSDDEFWRRREAEMQREARQAAEQTRRQRVALMCTYGAPQRIAELVVSPEYDPQQTAPALLQRVLSAGGEGGGAGGVTGRGCTAVLSGGVGVGKTAAAVWWQMRWGGARPAFIRAAAFAAAGRYDRRHREQWTMASSLVLDDLGVEYADAKGSLLADLDELVDLYHAERRPLVITTNLVAEDFRERYRARIASRVRADGGWLSIPGPDQRGVGR